MTRRSGSTESVERNRAIRNRERKTANGVRSAASCCPLAGDDVGNVVGASGAGLEIDARRETGPQQQGAILVLALLVSLVLLGFGLMVLWVASPGGRSSLGGSRRQEAFEAAEAGVERARQVLARAADWSVLLSGCRSPGDDRDRRGHLLCEGSPPRPLRGVPLVKAREDDDAAGNQLPPRYTVWVRNDWVEECDAAQSNLLEVDCDGDGRPGQASDLEQAMTDSNGRVLVVSEGRSPEGITVRLEVLFTRASVIDAAPGYSQQRLSSSGSSSLHNTDL